jgi:hypothetical protein
MVRFCFGSPQLLNPVAGFHGRLPLINYDQLHWELQETPRGARLKITADNKPALDAVHQFLRFQIEDHKTGDCTAIR